MKTEEIFKKELHEIENKMILELDEWFGESDTPGYRGIIITNSGELYKYQYLYELIKKVGNEEIYIKKVKNLSEEEYKKVIMFMENKLLSVELKNNIIYDAGYSIEINYNGIKKTIENELEIYNMTKLFLEELLNLKNDSI